MIDRLFNLVLLLCALVGGTLAVGTELLRSEPASLRAEARIATLPRVVVTGHKQTDLARAEPAASGEARFTQ